MPYLQFAQTAARTFVRFPLRRNMSAAASQGKYIAVIDEGTTSTRTALFDHSGKLASTSQQEFRQIMPQKGWVEHDPIEILEKTKETMNNVMQQAGANGSDVSCLGITNQRETTVVWDRHTGQPLHNAIVWMDTRADSVCGDVGKVLEGKGRAELLQEVTGLPLSAYFSGPKIKWLIDHSEDVRRAVNSGNALVGTIDTWLLWNLTGGTTGSPRHATDVSNASRTLLMDIEKLDWDDHLLELFSVPREVLPDITPSSTSSQLGVVDVKDGNSMDGVRITGILGDQQAALFGHACFERSQAKCTYGTGAFALKNIGTTKKLSKNGLLTTIAFQLENKDCVYALEGSVAIGGALIQWLRDNLELISNAKEVNELAEAVEDNGGVYFVPAFSGLYAPHWRQDARGCIVGLTRFIDKNHLARASLEAIAFQVRDVLVAMANDSGVKLKSLNVDGGATASNLLMQFQSDILHTPVVKPRGADHTTALGAAFAAGLGAGVYKSLDEVTALALDERTWQPTMEESTRKDHVKQWEKAVARSLDWVE